MKGLRTRSWLAGTASGLSQAYGTGHAWLGLAIAVALLAFEPAMFVLCIFAVVLALPFSRWFEPDRFEQGLYLFNPFLFGCFSFAAFGLGVKAFAVIAVAVPVIVVFALRLDAIGRRTYFTAPYIAAAYVSFAALQGRLPAFPVVDAARADFASGIVTSFAQVLLSADIRIGLVVLIAGLVFLPLPTIVACVASTLLSLAWLAMGLPQATSAAGLVGYNAVILSFYVGYDVRTQMARYVVALVGGFVAHALFFAADFAAYTFPFVVSGWIYVALRARMGKQAAGRPG